MEGSACSTWSVWADCQSGDNESEAAGDVNTACRGSWRFVRCYVGCCCRDVLNPAASLRRTLIGRMVRIRWLLIGQCWYHITRFAPASQREDVNQPHDGGGANGMMERPWLPRHSPAPASFIPASLCFISSSVSIRPIALIFTAPPITNTLSTSHPGIYKYDKINN